MRHRPRPPVVVDDRLRALCLGGGGIRALAYVPILVELDRRDLLRQVNRFAGTSAGAISAALLAMGAGPREIERILGSAPWREFGDLDWLWLPHRAWRLLARGWANHLDAPREWLAGAADLLGWHRGTTLAELRARSGRSLQVVATCERDLRTVVFGPEATPEVPILEAVLASMAVPVFWEPALVQGVPHSDGGLTSTYPASLFAELPPAQVLGLKLETGRRDEPLAPRERGRGLIGRAWGLVQIAVDAANRAHVADELWPRTVQVFTGRQPSLDFDLTDEERHALRVAGEVAIATQIQWG